jgi:hypothetical protein
MPNRLTEAFDRAADVLNENWAQANEFGDVIPLKYFDPLNLALPPKELACVMSESTFEPVFDEDSQHTSVRELRQADVRTPIVVASGITGLIADAVFEWNGERWAFDEANSSWDSEFVTFGLMREPLTNMNELRRAPV